MAERDGEVVGSIALVRKSETVGQLRLLLVEPAARGLGVGRRLVHQCVRFARQVGYRKITLYTHDTLAAARHLYEEAGFRLVHEEPDDTYGRPVKAQTWDLEIPGPPRSRTSVRGRNRRTSRRPRSRGVG
jgi:N-acetylglutamate synthase-like GNAT family acetyltransferase